jgi:hypothetical protein
MAEVSVLVEGGAQHFPEVVPRLRQAGLEVVEELREIGVVTGSIDAQLIEALGQVEGVARVEPAREFRLPPPEGDIQ